MNRNFIFDRFPFLEKEIAWINIVKEPTSVHSLDKIGTRWGHRSLAVKREDETDAVYGGNKVRNLEFVIGEALARNCKGLVTVVPYGSNFTAALAAQAEKHGLELLLAQFTVFRNEQIDATARFCALRGARLRTFPGKPGAVAAGLAAAYRMTARRLTKDRAYWITPGASNVLGALGHANALLELAAQIERGEAREPDYIVVGSGTCGTTAGLLAGIAVSGMRTRLIGIQCADPIVCNRRRIVAICNATLAKLRSPLRIDENAFQLERSPENIGYAIPIPEAVEVMAEFSDCEGMILDTTYTSKVALWLKQNLARGEFVARNVLYWHTFTPAALVACGDLTRMPWATSLLSAASDARSGPRAAGTLNGSTSGVLSSFARQG